MFLTPLNNILIFFFLSGHEIIVSNNILDVASALDVSLYSHMTIRCNRPHNGSQDIKGDLDCDQDQIGLIFGKKFQSYSISV